MESNTQISISVASIATSQLWGPKLDAESRLLSVWSFGWGFILGVFSQNLVISMIDWLVHCFLVCVVLFHEVAFYSGFFLGLALEPPWPWPR